MEKHHFKSMLLGLATLLAGQAVVNADLIPPGNKSATHKLVFVDSPLLQEYRVIAAPVRGFGGHEEVQAGRPFHFSTKYGTRLYVVPKDFEVPGRVGPGKPLPFPSCEVPVGSVTYVPVLSPVASLRSTCKLVAVGDDAIEVELVDHAEFDSLGRPVSFASLVVPMLAISVVGLIGCAWISRRTGEPTNQSDPQATGHDGSQTE